MIQPVSCCFIVGNDEKIFDAIASIRPHVAEIVVVHNGLIQEGGDAFYLKLLACETIDKLAHDPCWTDEHGLFDFAAARNVSYSLATQPWVIWMDSDDLFEGTFPVLADIPDSFENARVVMPYQYGFDIDGRCNSLQVRERITRRADGWEWRRPVHEGLFLREGTGSTIEWEIGSFVHKREESKTSIERNWRILKRQRMANGAEGELNARFWFDYGFAAIQADDRIEGRLALRTAIDLTDWPAEREVAAIRLILSYLDQDDEDFVEGFPQIAPLFPRNMATAIANPMLAAFACEALAKAADVDRRRGVGNQADGYYRGIVSIARWALASGTRNPLWFNPVMLSFNVRRLLHIALSFLTRHDEALEQIIQLRDLRPSDGGIQAMYWSCRSMIEKWEQYGGDRTYDVVFVCNHTPEAWDWESPNTTGIGGSETAVIAMARELSKLGLRVAVYGGLSREGEDGRVVYRRIERIGEVHHARLLVAWRSAVMLELCPADVRWLWVHDVLPAETTPYRLHLADRIFALSNWHREKLIEKGFHDEKVFVTSNGIDPSRFARTDIPRTRTAIYSSSPDRGLRRLLDLWPEIEAGVEKRTGEKPKLRVFYGDHGLDDGTRGELRAKMREVGAIWEGRVNQQTLAEAMLGAVAFLYPSSFEETSMIGMMEAKAAGLRIVIKANAGAQVETLTADYPDEVNGDGVFIAELPQDESGLPIALQPGVTVTPEHVAFGAAAFDRMFVQDAIDAICREERPNLARSMARSGQFHAWANVAKSWVEQLCFDTIDWHPRQKHDAITTLARGHKTRTIHFFLGEPASGSAIFDPMRGEQVARGGGCRDGFIGLVRAFALLKGWRVRAASTWDQPHKFADGVEWVSLAEMGQYARPDVALAFYDTAPLVGMHGCLRIASHHTYEPFRHFGWADVHTAPSKHSLESLRRRFEPNHPWYVLPNGVRDEKIVRKPVPGRVIYHTSPDRGAHLVLEAWPTILENAPHATLHMGGDIDGMLSSRATAVPSMKDSFGHRVERLRAAKAVVERLGGVTFLGPMPRAKLLEELAEAEVFAYPAAPIAPSETFSVSIMECCRAGIPVITSTADSLEEIYGESQIVLDSMEDTAGFGRVVADVLNNPSIRAELSASGQELAARFTFEREALVLQDIIERHLAAA